MTRRTSRSVAPSDAAAPESAAPMTGWPAGSADGSSPRLTGARIPRKRKTRSELAGEARESIFRAAAEVVGRHGYANASISKITELAGIAQGTFYLYFGSRQDLFDELLPHVGGDMIAFVSRRIRDAKDVYDVEERGFRGFFEYLHRNPGFFTILNQAETAAPAAYEKHFRILTERYVRSLRRSVERGEIRKFSDKELEAIAYMLMAMRNYLYLRYVKMAGSQVLPGWVVSCYMKFVRDGLR